MNIKTLLKKLNFFSKKEKTVVTDYLGQKLKIGDTVVYAEATSTHTFRYVTDVVCGFSKRGCKNYVTLLDCSKIWYKVIKIDKLM